MRKYLVLFLLLLITRGYGQTDSTFRFQFRIVENKLMVYDNDIVIHEKQYTLPNGHTIDLDEDNNDEYVVVDQTSSGSELFYTVYVYNTLDSFYLADSIYSGVIKPWETASEDQPGVLIAAGNPAFDRFNNLSEVKFSTLNIWKFVEGSIYLVNSEVYDIFIDMNNEIIGFIDKYVETVKIDCTVSRELLGALAAVYGNYLSAGEDALAIKFLNEYYLCGDIKKLEDELKESLM